MKSFFLLIFTFAFSDTFSQSRSVDSLLSGTWKGTSICQVKPSACQDEIAIYHITAGNKPGHYRMVMNKEVNGKEEEMGVNDYTYDVARKALTCYDEKYKLDWKFTLTKDSLQGQLIYQEKVYRIIRLTKVADH